jgi:exodeoxyribonuclease-3
VSLRVLSYNIRLGGSGREQAIASVINFSEPDLVILEEATRPDVVRRLASGCGMKHWGAVHGDSLAFLSRIDLAHHAWHEVRFARRRYLEIVLPGSAPRIFGVHLSAIHSNVTERRRMYELRSVLAGIAVHQHGMHVVTGDFNTLAPGEQLDLRKLPLRLRLITWITGRKIRWRTIQAMLDAGYSDGYRLFETGHGYTFPTWDPHVRLDYAFIPTPFKDRMTRCTVICDAPSLKEASDHFPLLFEME